MRILHIASGDFFSTYGGGQVYVKNVVDEMLRQHLDIVIVSMTGNHRGVLCKNYNNAPLYEIGSPTDLEKAILKAKPDVIHAHSLKDTACTIGLKLAIPVVVTSHHGGILCPAGTRLNCKDEICYTTVCHNACLPCVLRNIPAWKLWYRIVRGIPPKAYLKMGEWLSKRTFVPFLTPICSAARYIDTKQRQWQAIVNDCSIMIAPCHEIAEAMMLNGLDKEKIRVIPHGIPLPPARPDFPPVINGKVKFYYVGRICYVKGIHTLLEAFSSVNNAAIEMHLIGGAGNKHELRYMKKLQKKHSGDKRIIWHGKIAPESIFEATRKYHVSSSAAFLEAFGLNIAESLALGKPVLSTRSGGGEMQIRDGENGWIVPTNNPKALSEKIAYISNNSDILPQMSANCQAISLQVHCKCLCDTYREVQDIFTNHVPTQNRKREQCNLLSQTPQKETENANKK